MHPVTFVSLLSQSKYESLSDVDGESINPMNLFLVNTKGEQFWGIYLAPFFSYKEKD
jgi:hypothetical protein